MFNNVSFFVSLGCRCWCHLRLCMVSLGGDVGKLGGCVSIVCRCLCCYVVVGGLFRCVCKPHPPQISLFGVLLWVVSYMLLTSFICHLCRYLYVFVNDTQPPNVSDVKKNDTNDNDR